MIVDVLDFYLGKMAKGVVKESLGDEELLAAYKEYFKEAYTQDDGWPQVSKGYCERNYFLIVNDTVEVTTNGDDI